VETIERDSVFEETVRTYDSLKTEQERTAAEGVLWSKALRSERKAVAASTGKKIDRGEWLVVILGNEASGPRMRNLYDLRARLSKAPLELWQYIETSGCTLHTAISIYKTCLDLMSKDGKLSFAVTLQNVLDNPPMYSKPRERKGQKTSGASSKPYWSTIHTLIHKLVDTKTEGLSEELKKKLEEELFEQIHACYSSFSNKAKRYIDEKKGVSTVLRRERMLRACDLLQVDKPGNGELVDLRRARKRKLELVKVLHPDSANNNTDTTAYQSVIEAYDDMEAYNDDTQKERIASGKISS